MHVRVGTKCLSEHITRRKPAMRRRDACAVARPWLRGHGCMRAYRCAGIPEPSCAGLSLDSCVSRADLELMSGGVRVHLVYTRR